MLVTLFCGAAQLHYVHEFIETMIWNSRLMYNKRNLTGNMADASFRLS